MTIFKMEMNVDEKVRQPRTRCGTSADCMVDRRFETWSKSFMLSCSLAPK